jgi:GTP cyclohydrolase IA
VSRSAPEPSPPAALASARRARVQDAVAELLDALGVDRSGEALRDTPARVARMFEELLRPEPLRLTTFPNEDGYDELVLVRDIAVASLCEHHLLPFVGRAHVAYIPGDRIIGLSKLPRLVEHESRGLQVQERLTTRIADRLERELAPRGIGVVVEATHLCMAIRGVRQPGAVTTTSALRGLVRSDARTRQEFLALAAGGERHPRPA